MNELDDSSSNAPPIWAIFGDLMSGLVGVFVLLLIWALGFQLELAQSLKIETAKRQVEEQRRKALEEALVDPLRNGRVTLENGRIAISGSVLFAVNSDQLQPEGRILLASLIAPLKVYLGERDQMLMISGYTDDRPIRGDNRSFSDNWELSAQRALTVTRVLIQEGMPANMVFAAAFGDQSPVASNEDEPGRAQNRRVEMSPVPRNSAAAEVETKLATKPLSSVQ
ncbi:OmpA family protein [Arenicella xantha]|uniref:OmpA family protein n=1 Tax=Arenicella xantha TaxID=644221 RepID=A0A395JPU8_9GAMM|nr:OmpA family protein [Arenicella xantha]RBP50730.1 OmpA family protein [Arenicella xantha]